MERDLFGYEINKKPIAVNIYADEIMSKVCPYEGHKWHYIGIIVEDIENPLLPYIKKKRFRDNFDESSQYYKKNNHIIHWSKLKSADEKNICKRWFEYILNPAKSEKKFYSYILGLNNDYLNKDEFDTDDEFNSKYNRFFRSAMSYALKCFFYDSKVIIKNIYHEQGQQQQHEYFPWHSILKLNNKEENFIFETDKIEFLHKDHKIDEKANIIQLCDCFMGAVTNIIHGIEKSKQSEYKVELLDIILPLVQRMIREPKNVNSSYKHANRIMISFFPKEQTNLGDPNRYTNQFYTKRRLKYEEDKSGQLSLF